MPTPRRPRWKHRAATAAGEDKYFERYKAFCLGTRENAPPTQATTPTSDADNRRDDTTTKQEPPR